MRSPSFVAQLPASLLPAALAVALTAVVAFSPSVASASVRELHATGQASKGLVFEIRKSDSWRIMSGSLITGRRAYAVDARRLRTAAQHGKVRLRLVTRGKKGARIVRITSAKRLSAQERRYATASHHARGKHRLVIITNPQPVSQCLAVVGGAAHAKRTSWRPVGSRPISDSEAASLALPAPERRTANASANAYCPSEDELKTFHAATDRYGQSESNPGCTFNILRRYVTGRFTGTTDEIISWAAHKWGIPEDIIRAQAVAESSWYHSTKGDRRTVSDPSLYPDFSRIAGTSDVYESLGLMQVKWRPFGEQHPGTEPLRWKSVAFNVDFYASTVRYYFDDPEGKRSCWGDTGYVKGDEWLSVGGWYSPWGWGNSLQLSYIEKVKKHLADQTWKQSGF